MAVEYSELFQKEYRRMYGKEDSPVHVDFLFCGYVKENGVAHPQIIRLSSRPAFRFGIMPITDRGFAFSGAENHGAVLYLHHRLYKDRMPLEKAKLLAYFILKEVADLDNAVGEPIEIEVITESGSQPRTDLDRYEEKLQEIIGEVKLMLGL